MWGGRPRPQPAPRPACQQPGRGGPRGAGGPRHKKRRQEGYPESSRSPTWEIQSLTAGVPGEVATQMGNQGYSTDAIRVAREMVWAGEIGDVTEVHAWHGGAVGALEIAS